MRGGERTMFCEYTCLPLYNWIMRLKVWWWVSVPNHQTVLNDMAAGMKCFPHTVALGKLYLTGWNRTYAVFVCICVINISFWRTCVWSQLNLGIFSSLLFLCEHHLQAHWHEHMKHMFSSWGHTLGGRLQNGSWSSLLLKFAVRKTLNGAQQRVSWLTNSAYVKSEKVNKLNSALNFDLWVFCIQTRYRKMSFTEQYWALKVLWDQQSCTSLALAF